VILTASILKIYVTWQGTNVKLPDDDIEMLKHVGECIIQGVSRGIVNILGGGNVDYSE